MHSGDLRYFKSSPFHVINAALFRHTCVGSNFLLLVTNINYYIKYIMKLSCKDIDPESNCHFEVAGNNATEVAKKMMMHAKLDHSEDIDGMADDEVMKMLEAKVHS